MTCKTGKDWVVRSTINDHQQQFCERLFGGVNNYRQLTTIARGCLGLSTINDNYQQFCVRNQAVLVTKRRFFAERMAFACKCHFFLYLRHAPSLRVGSLRNYTTAMPGISKSSRRKMMLRVSFFSMRGHIRASPCGTLILKNANNCNFSSRKLVNVHFFS